MTYPGSALLLPARLAEVRRSGLLDTGPEEPFDRLTRLACELLGTPFGFVTVVDERRSFWKSCIGIDSTDPADRQNAVEESFCQYVIATDAAVIIDDARLDPMTRANPSIESMGVVAWAGFPVRAANGQVLGTFCVVDARPRQWSARDSRTLEVLAHAAGGEIALRVAAEEAALAATTARATAARYEQVARTLRETLLPRSLPAIDGLEVAGAHQLTGGDVPGGFYDAVRTPTGWAVFFGESTGRGSGAARTGVLARSSIRAAAERAASPVIVLSEVHASLQRWFDETGVPGLVSVAYLALRPAEAGVPGSAEAAAPGFTGAGFAARICTVGHSAAIIRRADGSLHRLGQPSGALGGPGRLSLKVDDDALLPGDRLLLLSGNITDAAHEAMARWWAIAEAGSAQQLADEMLRRASDAAVDADQDFVALVIQVA